jgi:co-chaperonin GroES (HSP10)
MDALERTELKTLNVGGNTIGFNYASLEEAFPTVDPEVVPMGSSVLIQVRQPKRKTGAGIILTPEDRLTEFYNTQVGKIIAVGPVAFRNRNDMAIWPEGAWCEPGDYVRFPKYQGDRFTKPFKAIEQEAWNGIVREKEVTDEATFIILKDLALLGKYTSRDACLVRAFW